jgi:hypothetical protein
MNQSARSRRLEAVTEAALEARLAPFESAIARWRKELSGATAARRKPLAEAVAEAEARFSAEAIALGGAHNPAAARLARIEADLADLRQRLSASG